MTWIPGGCLSARYWTPDPGDILPEAARRALAVLHAFFQATGLPDWLFDLLIAATPLFVIMGWILIYARSHGRSFRARGKAAEWIGTVQIQLDLLFANGLYMDALGRGLGRVWLRVTSGLERSRIFFRRSLCSRWL